MAEGLLDSNKNVPKSEKEELEDEGEDFSLRCGWRSCRPDSLQRFVDPKWFISAIALFSLTQGMSLQCFLKLYLYIISNQNIAKAPCNPLRYHPPLLYDPPFKF